MTSADRAAGPTTPVDRVAPAPGPVPGRDRGWGVGSRSRSVRNAASTSDRSSPVGHLVGLVLVATLVGVLLGRALERPGEAPPAGAEGRIEALRSHLAAQPDDGAAWLELGDVHLDLAIEADDAAHYVAADEAYRQVERLVPGRPEAARGRAMVGLGLHHFDRAEVLASQAHRARPQDPVALAALVDAQIEMGHYDDAGQHLQVLLDLRPDVAALARLSYLRQFLGDDAGAIEAMLQARVAAEGSVAQRLEIDVLLAEVFAAQGRLDDAAEAIGRARQARPDLPGPAIGEARLRSARGDLAGAIALLEPTVAQAPSEAGLMLLTDVYAAAGEARRSSETFDELRAFVRAEDARGFGIDSEVPIFLATWGDPAYAVELARRIVAQRPESIHAQQALAWASFRLGLVTESVGPLERALRLGTNDARLLYHAAEIYAAAGEPARAVQHLRRSLAINPRFSAGLAPAVADLAAELGVTPG